MNVQYVNNTPSNITEFHAVFAEAYKTGVLPEDYADLFVIKILKGFNDDGSDRMIVDVA